METTKVPLDSSIAACAALARRIAVRTMSADEFIERYSSGTLRKNKRLGMAWKAQYLSERTAFEYGWGFECLPRSRVTFGDAYTIGDCSAVTEAGWFCDRYIETRTFPEDRLEVKYIQVEDEGEARREGIGLILRETSAPFVPDGHIVFAIVAAWDVAKATFHEAENPS